MAEGEIDRGLADACRMSDCSCRFSDFPKTFSFIFAKSDSPLRNVEQ